MDAGVSCLGSNPGPAIYQLCDPGQVNLVLCASISLSINEDVLDNFSFIELL